MSKVVYAVTLVVAMLVFARGGAQGGGNCAPNPEWDNVSGKLPTEFVWSLEHTRQGSFAVWGEGNHPNGGIWVEFYPEKMQWLVVSNAKTEEYFNLEVLTYRVLNGLDYSFFPDCLYDTQYVDYYIEYLDDLRLFQSSMAHKVYIPASNK